MRKNMASGGGMGTTGASASATIFGLNKLLNLNLLDNELIELASLGEAPQVVRRMWITWLLPCWEVLFL
ncbi:MAG: hypothetical protein R2759_19475 [Bacteroidales bacterium]